MRTRAETLGGLLCRRIDSGPFPREGPAIDSYAVILCHGYGAPGDDLVPIGWDLMRADPAAADRFRFIFPEAPIVLGDFGGMVSRAWWHLDERVLAALMGGGPAMDVRRETPPELPAARERILRLLAALEENEGIPIERTILGGFSQGAILATDVVLRTASAPAALVVFSGSLVCEDEWQRLAPARSGLPVLLTHGRHDAILSFRAAEALRGLLDGAGLNVEFLPFDGPHTISEGGMEALLRLLRRTAGRER